MKKLLFISIIALSLVSCSVKNTYSVVSLNRFGHNYSTQVTTTANWQINEEVEIQGHPFKVLCIESSDIVSK